MPPREPARELSKAEVAERDRLLAELATLASAEDERKERRHVVFARLRELGTTNRRIAEAAGVTEPAVIQALRRRREADATAGG